MPRNEVKSSTNSYKFVNDSLLAAAGNYMSLEMTVSSAGLQEKSCNPVGLEATFPPLPCRSWLTEAGAIYYATYFAFAFVAVFGETGDTDWCMYAEAEANARTIGISW